jgi:hypothetical protein
MERYCTMEMQAMVEIVAALREGARACPSA